VGEHVNLDQNFAGRCCLKAAESAQKTKTLDHSRVKSMLFRPQHRVKVSDCDAL
jgi:hypothetical protein